jgi:hypothetical protein
MLNKMIFGGVVVNSFTPVTLMKYALPRYSLLGNSLHKAEGKKKLFQSPHAPHLSKLLFIFYFESFVSYRKCQVMIWAG